MLHEHTFKIKIIFSMVYLFNINRLITYKINNGANIRKVYEII